MPRMIYWNVQLFSEDKFYVRGRKRKRDEEEDWGVNYANRYRRVLLRTVRRHQPDFIVIAELRRGGRVAQGALLRDTGALRMLESLRGDDANWQLVPPLLSGLNNAGEGIAVFWRRSARLWFTGPWRWPGGGGPAAPFPGATGAYPGIIGWDDALDRHRRTPNHAENLYARDRWEDQLAGQWRYPGPMGLPMIFGSPTGRSPFHVTFYDSVARQNYSIYALHMTPSQRGGPGGVAAAPSTLGSAQVGNLPGVQAAGARETVVVIGDFNVSLFDAAATAVAYGPFGAAGHQQLIEQVAGHPMPAGYPSRGYLITHIKAANRATPSWARGYPAFDYGSARDAYGQYDSIDNGFVLGGAVGNVTIANIVSGAPYTRVPAPADVPTGALAYRSRMENPAALNVPAGYNPAGMSFLDETDLFQDVNNYGRVYGVSDHLPIAFDF